MILKDFNFQKKMLPLILFINDKPSNIKNIILNKNCEIKQFDEQNIYEIFINNQTVNWLVKTYTNNHYAKTEVDILSQLENVEGVPRLFAFGTSSIFSYIVISKIDGDSLHIYKGMLDENKLKHISKQLLTILSKMHFRGLIHKDIKPENIIYNKATEKTYLIDFEQKMTDGFECPEFFKIKETTTKWDIWSFGITIYELYYGILPFKNQLEILNKNIEFKTKISDNFRDFIECCLEKKETDRWTSEKLLDHSWMT